MASETIFSYSMGDLKQLAPKMGILGGSTGKMYTVLSAVLLKQNFEPYSLTKKLFPTGFYAAIRAAMLCFYSYVVASGGNPPPNKLKSSAAAAS